MPSKSEHTETDAATASKHEENTTMANETKTATGAASAEPTKSASEEILTLNKVWGELASKNGEAVALAAQGTMEYAMACSEASTALGLDRARKAQDMVKACLDTREAPQLIRITAEYQRTMLEDYIGHAQKILGMTLDRAHATTNAFEERAQTTFDEVKKAA